MYTFTTTVNLYYNGIFPELVVSSKRGCRPTSLHRFMFLLLFGHRHAAQSSSPTTASCRPSVRSTMRPQKKHAISAASASASVVCKLDGIRDMHIVWVLLSSFLVPASSISSSKIKKNEEEEMWLPSCSLLDSNRKPPFSFFSKMYFEGKNRQINFSHFYVCTLKIVP